MPLSLPGPLPFASPGEEVPAFAEPWQARAFGMTLALFEAGCFTWPEWTDALSAEIAAARDRGEPDLGDTYYRHWLAALERLAAAKALTSVPELAERKDAWAHAAEHTPHGQPITLDRAREQD